VSRLGKQPSGAKWEASGRLLEALSARAGAVGFPSTSKKVVQVAGAISHCCPALDPAGGCAGAAVPLAVSPGAKASHRAWALGVIHAVGMGLELQAGRFPAVNSAVRGRSLSA